MKMALKEEGVIFLSKKEKQKPVYLLKLEAALRRVVPNFVRRGEIVDELGRTAAGYRGERSIGYDLNYIDEKKYSIFNAKRLPGVGSFFQLDNLLASSQFLLIPEVKNMSGELYFDKHFNQLVQLKDGERYVYPDPIEQVERQKEELMIWLAKGRFPDIPIETLVVFTNPHAYIKASPDYTAAFEKVIRSIKLPYKIRQFEGKYIRDVFSNKDLRRLARWLERDHTPYNPDILQKFGIRRADIMKGVHCPKCFKFAMNRGRNIWTCPHCHFSSEFAHIPSINDYFLLIGETITNRELREFLQVESRHVASNVLTSLGVPHSGGGRHRKYHLILLNEDGI